MSKIKNILITGASRGIGLLTAKTLATKGYHVIASMRHIQTKNARIAEELTSWAKQNQYSLEVAELDITSDDSVNHALQKLEKKLDIDVIINNAGIMPCGVTEAYTPEQMAECFDINVIGVARVCRAVLPFMRERRSGLLIHLSSNSGRLAMPFFGLYCASKWALEALAESLHYELSSFGIESLLVEPGGHATDLITNPPPPKDLARLESYGEISEAPSNLANAFREVFANNDPSTDAQNVADKIADLIASSKQRPIRTTVGHDMGISEINRLVKPIQADFVRAFLPLAGVASLKDDNRLFVQATIHLKAEHINDGLTAIEKIIPLTLKEPGCQVFTLMQDNSDKTKLYLFEIFDDEESLEYHYSQEYTKDVFSNYERWLAAPIEINKMQSTSSLTTEQF